MSLHFKKDGTLDFRYQSSRQFVQQYGNLTLNDRDFDTKYSEFKERRIIDEERRERERRDREEKLLKREKREQENKYHESIKIDKSPVSQISSQREAELQNTIEKLQSIIQQKTSEYESEIATKTSEFLNGFSFVINS